MKLYVLKKIYLGFTQAVNMTVEGTPYLRQTIQQLKRANGELTTAKATRTVCPAFDGNLLLIECKDRALIFVG